MFTKCIVVMGVSGSGKTTVGEMLASEIRAKFIDGDDLHPKANILKMASGEPLNDDDRKPWLERINDALFSLERKNETCVLVCSALKKRYRQQIRQGNKNLIFIYLEGSVDTIVGRLNSREGHFMKSDLVYSQFQALESPISEADVITINIAQPLQCIITQAVVELNNIGNMATERMA